MSALTHLIPTGPARKSVHRLGYAISGLGLLLTASLLSADTNLVSGEVTANTEWSGTNLLEGTVVIRSTAVVTVAPGTRLLMNTGAVLRVEGQFLADGTADRPITITRATATSGWGRFLFVRAADSRLRHCTIEFAQSVGDHQDYYDNDCETNTPPLPRTYHEAVVALATHLDLEHCVFQNLPDSTGNRDGDALAVISDDPLNPGTASATITQCRFQSIGQAIHTRFSYVLVQACYFADKHGDNDDVDLYGESTPPPLIRNNVFLAGHEDKINPTRCSAIIVGNFITGSDDHGIVLRDRGRPLVMNNLILNCTSAGISVQNQCDALIANNTIVNSQRGIRFFDHFDRHGPPYCLTPGSGRATVVNCILWDCDNSLVLTDSPDGHSAATIAHCLVQGGAASTSTSANSTLVWGPGNLDLDPRFANLATNNFRLLADSPALDAGTNLLDFAPEWAAVLTDDFEGIPRPLDGLGDGTAQPDLGAHEFLLTTADSNADGIPDGWTWDHGFSPIDAQVAASNPDADPATTFEEWVADTDPNDPLSYFQIWRGAAGSPVALEFRGSTNRLYSLERAAALGPDSPFAPLPGHGEIPGNGATSLLTDPDPTPDGFYRVKVRLRD